MFELFRAATRKDCAVTQAQVRPVVENCYVSFAKQSGNRAKGAAESISKTWRGLKRIIGLAREEIAKAEFCRVFTHTQRSLGLFAMRLDFEGIKRISVAKVSPATTLR